MVKPTSRFIMLMFVCAPECTGQGTGNNVGRAGRRRTTQSKEHKRQSWLSSELAGWFGNKMKVY